ncbi:MAG: transglycosylase SLT domain-containing protein [Clostridiales Family XIII bacterium]|jgi:hypothetical protein|nr:transglycosylase SLT domain-containing protein [Clostridiales Family XIII bacterium]
MFSFKKILAIVLSVAVVMLSAVPASASGGAYGKFFLKDIVINGVQIVNYNLQYPFFIYEDLTYIPLTPDMGDIFGFGYAMDWERNVLELWKKEASISNIRDNRFKNDANDVLAWVEDSVLVVMAEPQGSPDAHGASGSAAVAGGLAGARAAYAAPWTTADGVGLAGAADGAWPSADAAGGQPDEVFLDDVVFSERADLRADAELMDGVELVDDAAFVDDAIFADAAGGPEAVADPADDADDADPVDASGRAGAQPDNGGASLAEKPAALRIAGVGARLIKNAGSAAGQQAAADEGPKSVKASRVFDTVAGQDAVKRVVDLGGKSVIMVGGILYLPLRAMADNVMGWDLMFDPNLGICISTREETPARSFFSTVQANFNKGLANYINTRNKSVSISRSQELVFLFKRAATVNKLDTKLLMAIAQKESNFRADAKSRSGAAGMMQIMPKTGAAMGVTPNQLLDAKTSIDKGAAYIRTQLNRYDNNVGLALSAYNQGAGNVSRGTFSRGYAESVSNIVKDIDAYLVNGGYATGN